MPAVIVNRTDTDTYWANGDPLGKRITFDDPNNQTARWYTIVCVVADTRRAGADRPVFTAIACRPRRGYQPDDQPAS